MRRYSTPALLIGLGALLAIDILREPSVEAQTGWEYIDLRPTLAPPPHPTTGTVRVYVDSTDNKLKWKDSTGSAFEYASTGGTGVPAGAIVMVVSGACPGGYVEETTLNSKTLFGTLNANADVGTTGGSDTLTHSGTAVADHPSHTHDYTQVLNHTHTINVTDPGHSHTERNNSATTGGLLGWGAADTSTNTAQNTGYTTTANTTGITASSADPAGGVATGTTAGPSVALSHSVTQPSSHDNRSAFVRVIFCRKT